MIKLEPIKINSRRRVGHALQGTIIHAKATAMVMQSVTQTVDRVGMREAKMMPAMNAIVNGSIGAEENSFSSSGLVEVCSSSR